MKEIILTFVTECPLPAWQTDHGAIVCARIVAKVVVPGHTLYALRAVVTGRTHDPDRIAQLHVFIPGYFLGPLLSHCQLQKGLLHVENQIARATCRHRRHTNYETTWTNSYSCTPWTNAMYGATSASGQTWVLDWSGDGVRVDLSGREVLIFSYK